MNKYTTITGTVGFDNYADIGVIAINKYASRADIFPTEK